MYNSKKKLLYLGSMAMMLAVGSSSVFAALKKVTVLTRDVVAKSSTDVQAALGDITRFSTLSDIIDADSKWTDGATTLFAKIKDMQKSAPTMAKIVEATFAKIVFLKSIEAWVAGYLNGLTRESTVDADTVETFMVNSIAKANLDGKGSINYEKKADGSRLFTLVVTNVDGFSCTATFDFKTGGDMRTLNGFVDDVIGKVTQSANFIKAILAQVHANVGNTALFYSLTPVAQLGDGVTVTLKEIIENTAIDIISFIESFATEVLAEATRQVATVDTARKDSGKDAVAAKASAQRASGLRDKIKDAVDVAVAEDAFAFIATVK